MVTYSCKYTFFIDSFFERFVFTIPRTLGQIYDELLQPLPDQLSELLSPDQESENVDSVMPSVAPSSIKSLNSSDMSEPLSQRTKRSAASTLIFI